MGCMHRATGSKGSCRAVEWAWVSTWHDQPFTAVETIYGCTGNLPQNISAEGAKGRCNVPSIGSLAYHRYFPPHHRTLAVRLDICGAHACNLAERNGRYVLPN
jgi:hypothetical protein